MNFARIDPGESGARHVIAPNKITETYKCAGAALAPPPRFYMASEILLGDSTGRGDTFAGGTVNS